MESVIREIQDLTPADRQAVEALLGCRLGPKGQLFVALLDELSGEQLQRWESLMAAVAPFHRNVASTGAPQDKLEEEIEQAISDVRTGQR